MNLADLASQIKHLNYVVMRNWEKMPPEGDLDFFVHPDDLQELTLICKGFFDDPQWYDIRTVGDNYFPDGIEQRLLDESTQERFDEWKIPDAEAHFISLYYHERVHKGDHRYDQKLDEIFFTIYPPVAPEDEGVGYHAPNQN